MIEILKIDKPDLEILKLFIKTNPDIGISIDVLFKFCKILKQIDMDIIRYYIAFNKSIVNFNSSTNIIRFIVIDYNKSTEIFNIIISL
jgi:hypothetical protein